MSWAEIKKAVNSDLGTPLNELLTKKLVSSSTANTKTIISTPTSYGVSYSAKIASHILGNFSTKFSGQIRVAIAVKKVMNDPSGIYVRVCTEGGLVIKEISIPSLSSTSTTYTLTPDVLANQHYYIELYLTNSTTSTMQTMYVDSLKLNYTVSVSPITDSGAVTI